MNLSEKADALSKTSCYHSDFYGMQFPVYWPVIFLPNKHMFHVKHMATNTYRIRMFKLYQKCPRAAIDCTFVLIFVCQIEMDVSHETGCR